MLLYSELNKGGKMNIKDGGINEMASKRYAKG